MSTHSHSTRKREPPRQDSGCQDRGREPQNNISSENEKRGHRENNQSENPDTRHRQGIRDSQGGWHHRNDPSSQDDGEGDCRNNSSSETWSEAAPRPWTSELVLQYPSFLMHRRGSTQLVVASKCYSTFWVHSRHTVFR